MSDKWSDREGDSYKSIKGALNYFKKSKLEKENLQLKQQLEAIEKQLYVLKDIDISENIDEGMVWVTERWFDKAELFEQQLEESVDVIEFYADRFSWNFSQHPDHEYYAGAIKDDDSLLRYKEKNGDEFEDYCGGKRARQFLAKYRGGNVK